eukprot:5880100-Lingulodinium_polyedra.AAC.1
MHFHTLTGTALPGCRPGPMSPTPAAPTSEEPQQPDAEGAPPGPPGCRPARRNRLRTGCQRILPG